MERHPNPQPTQPCKALTVSAFCSAVSVSRTRAFMEIKKGRLHAVKAGRQTLIPVEEMERWLGSLPLAARAATRTDSND